MQGRSSFLNNDALPPVLDFPLYSKKCQTVYLDNFTTSDDLSLVVDTEFVTSQKLIHFPLFLKDFILPYFSHFLPCCLSISVSIAYFTCFFLPPVLTMMHLCVTQYMYWTPL